MAAGVLFGSVVGAFWLVLAVGARVVAPHAHLPVIPLPVLGAYLRSRGVPMRLAAMGLAAAAGAALARLPLPGADPGLDPEAYPAVLVGVAAPVVVGALMAAPAPTTFGHLTGIGLPRARRLRAVEFLLVAVGAALAAAACGAAAGLSAAAVQNALVTGFAAIVLSAWAGAVAGTSVAACVAVAAVRVASGIPATSPRRIATTVWRRMRSVGRPMPRSATSDRVATSSASEIGRVAALGIPSLSTGRGRDRPLELRSRDDAVCAQQLGHRPGLERAAGGGIRSAQAGRVVTNASAASTSRAATSSTGPAAATNAPALARAAATTSTAGGGGPAGSPAQAATGSTSPVSSSAPNGHHRQRGRPVDEGQLPLQHDVADPPAPPGQPVVEVEPLQMYVPGRRDGATGPLVHAEAHLRARRQYEDGIEGDEPEPARCRSIDGRRRLAELLGQCCVLTLDARGVPMDYAPPSGGDRGCGCG